MLQPLFRLLTFHSTGCLTFSDLSHRCFKRDPVTDLQQVVAIGEAEIESKLDIGPGCVAKIKQLTAEYNRGGEAAVSALTTGDTVLSNVRRCHMLWSCCA